MSHMQFGLDLPLHRFIMERIDLVIVGAEGVVESGGIINKVGRTPSLSVVLLICVCYRLRIRSPTDTSRHSTSSELQTMLRPHFMQ